MKTFLNLILMLVIAASSAAGLQVGAGIDPAVTFGVSIGVALVTSLIAPHLPNGILGMALQVDIWEGEIMKKFRHENTFLSRIGRRDQYVEKNAIHLVDIGVDPEVLINNTTYPIPTVSRTDLDIVISLDKFDTVNTRISDDELHALPYDKEGSVIEDHREALEQASIEKSAHSLCPQASTSNTPIITTTGASNGYTNARKRMTIRDVISAKKALDDLSIPAANRELVLSNDHIEDLLLESQVFKEQYQKITTGTVLNMYGFIVSQFVKNPLFSNTTGEKKAFGSALAPTTDLAVSMFYYNKRAVQAKGKAKMYHALAETNPTMRESVIGFAAYHICLPKKNTGFGAIISSVV